ncbi:MAG: hypothetical protein Q8P05_02130 [Candidatus Diapherotrites archaeon]|nr:hypothetical protein [Candidatus Diapherotrites archaeon]MDZ4256882.1 hypothetical protein [archaeon]
MKKIYQKLLLTYGPQGWWPIWHADASKRYRMGSYDHPRNEKELLEICVGALLAQNTSWKNAEKAVEQLSKKGYFDSVKKLSTTKKEIVIPLIRSAGYYNQKADRIIRFAQHVKENHGTMTTMLKQPAETLRAELLGINGVGEETADSILVYAAHQPYFIADAYARRILTRVHGWGKEPTYGKMVSFVHEKMPPKPKNYVAYNEFHSLLVEHAKRYCTKTDPKCMHCPLRAGCRSALVQK